MDGSESRARTGPPVSTLPPDSGRAWWALVVITLAAGLSAPGQTIGVSVFIDPMLDGLSVTRSQLSGAYLVGTLTAALALPVLGTWTDRVGIRRALVALTTTFALALSAMSLATGLITLAVGFTLVRFSGQGGNAVVTGAAVAVWFDRRRGLAMGLLATGSGLLLASLPIALERTIAAVGWRNAWLVAGLGIPVVLLPLLIWTLDHQPAGPAASAITARPDTAPAPQPPPSVAATTMVSLTRKQALRTWPFWGLAALAAGINLLGTGVIFHHIAIMAERGLTALQATAVFVPFMVGGAIAGVTAGLLADRLPGRVMLGITMTAFTAGLLIGSHAAPGLLAATYGFLIGATGSGHRAVADALIPAWFGTRHVGSIQGVMQTIGIGASALGPLAVSVLEPLTFSAALRMLAVPAAILTVMALTLGPPRRTLAPATGREADR